MWVKDDGREFFAPDSFERDNVLTYCCTAAKGDDICGTTLTTSATDDYFTIADYVDTASLGYTSGMINVKTTADNFQDQIDSLREMVEKLKESARVGLLKDNRSLRSKLRTLEYGYEVL